MGQAYTSHRDAKKLAKQLRKGDTVYALWKVSPHVAPPGEAPYLYSEYTVTHLHVMTGTPMIGGAMSVERLVGMCEAVYLEPPRGYRNLADPSPQVGFPGDAKTDGKLKSEIKRLRKLAGV